MPRSRFVVGVDVTAHKEERNAAADPRKKSKLRARYYVELVVGAPRERHVRLGFAGSFKALLALHRVFERAYLERFGAEPPPRASLSSSASSGASHTSLSSASSPRGGVKKLVHDWRLKTHAHRSGNQSDDAAVPSLPVFPAAHKLLVKLEGAGDAKDDKKLATRVDALFEYYTQLFNLDEGELFVEIVQLRSIEQAEKNAAVNSSDSTAGPHDAPSQSARGGLFKFLSRHSLAKSATGSDLSRTLEFLAPMQVSSSGKTRPLKRVKPRRESRLS